MADTEKLTEDAREAAAEGAQPNPGITSPADERAAETAKAEAAVEAGENAESDSDDAPLYISKPGGAILQHADGLAENYEYGWRVDPSILSEGQKLHIGRVTTEDPSIERPRPANLDNEANLRAAIADSGQVQGTSSPIPGNYDQLSEDEALRFITTLAGHPSQQAVVVAYEKEHLNRRRVLDGAVESAVIDAKAIEKFNEWQADQQPSAPSMLTKSDAKKSASAAGNAGDAIGPVPVVDASGRDIPLPPASS